MILTAPERKHSHPTGVVESLLLSWRTPGQFPHLGQRLRAASVRFSSLGLAGANRRDECARLISSEQLAEMLEEWKRVSRPLVAKLVGKGGVDRRGRLLGDATAVSRADSDSGQSSILWVRRGCQDSVGAKRGDRLRDVALRQASADGDFRHGAVWMCEDVTQDEGAACRRLRWRPSPKRVSPIFVSCRPVMMRSSAPQRGHGCGFRYGRRSGSSRSG